MNPPLRPVARWLPDGKDAAICFTIDDVHPGRSSDHYDGGGDLDAGALGLVHKLLDRHPHLKATLFVTADWREISPTPSRLVRYVPKLRDRMFLTRVLPEGSRSVAKAPDFVTYLKELPRVEIGFHGLHHIHRGPLVHVEFQQESASECEAILAKMERIFARTSLSFVRGMCPPGWNAPPALLEAMRARDYHFVASARDILTAVTPGALTAMSGLRGAPLFSPAWVGEDDALLHFSTNFQATSEIERALAVIDAGGLLAVKAHIIKDALGHIALDGVDRTYMNYLDVLFRELERRYGDRLWWTSMGEIAARIRARNAG